MKHKKHSAGGIRSPTMPKDHFEHHEGEMGHESELKYASEFGNPKDLDKSTAALAGYVKSHKMKY